MTGSYTPTVIRAEIREVMSEADWQDKVLEFARWRGWHVAHFRPAETTKGWRTPMTGHKGFPDLVLARAGVVWHIELKTEKGRPTNEQTGWISAIGATARVWRPIDWPIVQKELW